MLFMYVYPDIKPQKQYVQIKKHKKIRYRICNMPFTVNQTVGKRHGLLRDLLLLTCVTDA